MRTERNTRITQMKKIARVGSKSRKKRGKKYSPRQKRLPGNLKLFSFKVTYDPMTVENRPHEVDEQVDELHGLAVNEPKKAIAPLTALIEKYPDVPLLYNYLTMAYKGTKQEEKAKEIIEKNYQQHPDYLFAKLNYAQLCLENNLLERIPEIFDGKFELGLLYPDRNEFHISEVVGFYATLTLYHIETEDYQQAKTLLKLLKKVAPDYPQTKLIEREVLYALLRKKFTSMF